VKEEDRRFGDEGFEKTMDKVAVIEKQIGSVVRNLAVWRGLSNDRHNPCDSVLDSLRMTFARGHRPGRAGGQGFDSPDHSHNVFNWLALRERVRKQRVERRLASPSTGRVDG
jgi:hypothetical protein